MNRKKIKKFILQHSDKKNFRAISIYKKYFNLEKYNELTWAKEINSSNNNSQVFKKTTYEVSSKNIRDSDNNQNSSSINFKEKNDFLFR